MVTTDLLDLLEIGCDVGYLDSSFAGYCPPCMFAYDIPETILGLACQVITHQGAIFAGQETCLIKLAINSCCTSLKVHGQRIAVGGQIYAEKVAHVAGRS